RTPVHLDPSYWPVPQLGPWPTASTEHHAIVVGAGIGGLAVAALLSKHGLKVLVVEAHDRPGGSCTSWTRKVRCHDGRIGGFTFDAGVQDISGLGPKGPLRYLLDQLDISRRLQWHSVRHRYVQDGFAFDMPGQRDGLASALTRQFPDEAAGIAVFVPAIDAIVRDFYSSADGIPHIPMNAAGAHTWAQAHPIAARWMMFPWAEYLDSHFQDAKLKQLLTVIAEYVTDRPELLTVGEMAPLFGYYLDGGYYPAGGSQRLADALSADIENRNGRVMLRTSVKQIVLEGGSAVGIRTDDGQSHSAPVIISNADLGATFATLIDPAALPSRYRQRLRSRRRGPSAFLVSLALDAVPDIPARLFLTTPTSQLGIGNPSVVDPSLAPPGHAVMTMMQLVPEHECVGWFAMDRVAYRRRKRALVDEMITTAETVIPGLRRSVLYWQAGTPRTAKRYLRTENGSIYGAERRQWSPDFRSPVPGLFLVGGGGRLGPGIEPVVISAVNLCRAILG
ncbi:MAG: NAD(P)/FAD-dependent oxidoreductase, partial [Hyphomicrobium sp.]